MMPAPRPGLVSRALVILAFGAAFGYVEAAVVVYLRAALGVVANAVPAHDPGTFGTFEGLEISRELATLVVIGAVGWLAGRTRLERLAWAAVAFGSWDIAYYAGLRVAIGWPPTLETWDVLFLVPTAWVGPVWAPLAVSFALIATGLAAARRLAAGGRLAVGAGRAAGALAGGGLVILSFTLGASGSGSGAWSGWPVFWIGMLLAAAASASAFVRPAAAPAARRGPVHHGSERRPPVGSTD